MENICRNLLLLTLFSAQVSAVTAQSSMAGGKALLGTWHMDAQDIVRHMGRTDRAAFDSLPDLQRERLVRSLGSRIFEFRENGDFLASWEAQGKPFSTRGKWSLEGDGKLRVIFPSETSMYKVTFPSAGSMVLEPLNRTTGLVKSLYFIKAGKP